MDQQRIEVPRDEYAEALGRELPDSLDATVAVDRRGYSEEVADKLGDDYLGSRMLVFGREQGDAATDGPDYLESLLDQLYADNRAFIDDADGPLAFNTHLHLASDGIQVTVRAEEIPAYSDLEEAQQLYDRTRSIDSDDLHDADHCNGLVQQYRATAIPATIQEQGLPETWAEETFTTMVLQHEDTELTVADGTIEVDGVEYSLEPFDRYDTVADAGGWQIGERSRGQLTGRVDSPVSIRAVHSGINAVIAPPERPPGDYDLPDPGLPCEPFSRGEHYRRKEIISQPSLEAGSLGRLSVVHDDINLLVLGDIAVDAYAGHGSVNRHGNPPDDPEYTINARSTHHDVTVHYLDPELRQPLEQIAAGQTQLDGGDDHPLKAYLSDLMP